LTRSLRAAGRRVWLHKPVACGDWDGASSADGRFLRALCGDGQDPASICSREFPAACSPHRAARMAGQSVCFGDLVHDARALIDRAQAAGALLLMESAGGVLSPLVDPPAPCSNADLVAALGIPALLVTRPHLGTLSLTACAVEACRARGIDLRGLVINHAAVVPDGAAVRHVSEDLRALTSVEVFAEIRHGQMDCDTLAQVVWPER